MMDHPAAAQSPQHGLDLVLIIESRCVDAKRLRHSPMPTDPVSKVLDDDNVLIKILVCLGFPTTLVQRALVCKRWLRHASDPAFLRRFRELHPPRLLGFYLDVRLVSLDDRSTHPASSRPQPAELAAVARRVANCLDAYHNVWIEDCQNGSILVRGCKYGDSTFGAGSSSRPVHYGEILRPLDPKGVVTIVPWPPYDQPMDTDVFHTDYTLLRHGGRDLSYLSLFESYWTFQGRKNSVAQIYMLKDGVWCMLNSNMAHHLCRTREVRPLLVDNKIYIAGGMRNILVLDLKVSSFSKFQLPEGVKFEGSNTMFSRTDNYSRLYLINVKKFQLDIWIHNGNNWLMEDAICLRQMCANLSVLDCTVCIDHKATVKIIQVGENAESACLQIGQYVLYLDIKCRVMRRVYEMAGNNQQYLHGIYPFTMIWPPTFPVLSDDPASQGSSLEMGGS